MSDNKLNDIISTSLENIRSFADANTIIGAPIETNNKTVIIPVSKVSFAFASGGVDYLPKNAKTDGTASAKPAQPAPDGKAVRPNGKAPYFGGGGGTGVTITPVCFIVVKENGDVELLDLADHTPVPPAVGIVDSVSGLIERSPDLIERFKTVFSKKKKDPSALDPDDPDEKTE